MTNSINGEAVTIPTIAESWRVPTEAIQEAVDEAIGQLAPVNDATLTIKQNNVTKGTFTANDADDTTIDLQDTTYTNFTGTDGASAGSAGLVPAPATTDADKFLKSDGTWAEGGASAVLYDSTGQNTDGAMTQKATTDALGGKQDTLTAGTNITIGADNEISATDTTYTAGTNVQISANNEISATDTTYSDFTGTDGTSAGTTGLVPAPATADADKFLKSDGTWAEAGGGGGGIPTDAKFWGQSYDSVNNKVSGDIDLGGGTKLIINDSSISNSGALILANGVASIGIKTTALNSAQYRFSESEAYFSKPLYMTQRNTVVYRQIKSMADPTDPHDAATKNYVDSIYPVGAVFTSTSATAPTIAGGTWTEIGTQTVGSSTVHYYERTA